jgi:hypothetical protein
MIRTVTHIPTHTMAYDGALLPEIWQEVIRTFDPHVRTDMHAALALCRTSRANHTLRQKFLSRHNRSETSVHVCSGECYHSTRHIPLYNTSSTYLYHGLVEDMQNDIWCLFECGRLIEMLRRNIVLCDSSIVTSWNSNGGIDSEIIFSRAVPTRLCRMRVDIYETDLPRQKLSTIHHDFSVVEGRLSHENNMSVQRKVAFERACHVLQNLPRLLVAHLQTPFWE